MLTPEKITELRALRAKATQGRWHPVDEGNSYTSVGTPSGGLMRFIASDCRNASDASLIAAVVNALPDLLDALERTRELLGEARKSIEHDEYCATVCEDEPECSENCEKFESDGDCEHVKPAADDCDCGAGSLLARIDAEIGCGR